MNYCEKYSKDDIISILSSSRSLKEFARKIGYSNNVGVHTYNTIKKHLDSLKINYQDFLASSPSIIGYKYGRLTIIAEATPRGEPSGNKCKRVQCSCDCGTIITVDYGHLKSGVTKSCGCLSREQAAINISKADRSKQLQRLKEAFQKHRSINDNNLSNTHRKRLLSIWENMKKRCYYKNLPSYQYYGARGIQVCDDWRKNFNLFYDWALSHGYDATKTLDRIDNNKDYSPENCRWVTPKQQARNKRNNTLIESRDGIVKTQAEWSEIYNIPADIIYRRRKRHPELKYIEDIIAYNQAERHQVEGFFNGQYLPVPTIARTMNKPKATVYDELKRKGLLRRKITKELVT